MLKREGANKCGTFEGSHRKFWSSGEPWNICDTIEAPQALVWWLGLMALNEEVVGSILHVGVVLTIIVHHTMEGGPWTLLYGYLKALWGDTMSGIFKALVASYVVA